MIELATHPDDPLGPLARCAHHYLRARRPALARLMERTAAHGHVRTPEYMAAILHDEMPPGLRALPTAIRVEIAALICVECALADSHRHN
jgi:hypothetical protein